jgi:signal transduction histidine kinase
MELGDAQATAELVRVMVRLYVGTLVLASLGVWWMVLSHESQEQSERELLESMQHLEQTRTSLIESEKLASLGGLVAGVAHEINTPVGIVVSTASYLNDRTRALQTAAKTATLERATVEKYLRDAGESARLLLSNATRLGQLVLNFKQLALNRASEERHRFDLREHVEDTIRDLQPRLSDASVAVRVDIAPGIEMDSYPIALAQVIANLVVNSLQHAFEPGDRTGQITIRGQLHEGDDVEIEYSDNGRGIAPALAPRVFEPFVTTRRLLGGSGLGLFLVNQIVTRQLNGSLHLDNGAGRGVRFSMRFPRIARHAPEVGRMLSALQTRPDDDS